MRVKPEGEACLFAEPSLIEGNGVVLSVAGGMEVVDAWVLTRFSLPAQECNRERCTH